MKITVEVLRKRYLELKDLRADVLKIIDPLDRKREKLLEKLQPLENELRELDEQRKKAKEPLFEIDNEIGRIARMLPGDRSRPAVDAQVVGNDALEEKAE